MGMTGEFLRTTPRELETLRSDHQAMFGAWFPDAGSEENRLSVDKAWDGIKFVLETLSSNGRIDELNPFEGPQETGIEFDYGPITFHSPEEVQSLSAALFAISSDAFRKGYLPDQMAKNDVYPEIWDRQEEIEGNYSYLWEYLVSLRDFYAKAASAGDVVLYTLM